MYLEKQCIQDSQSVENKVLSNTGPGSRVKTVNAQKIHWGQRDQSTKGKSAHETANSTCPRQTEKYQLQRR